MLVKYAFSLKRVLDHFHSKKFALISAYLTDLAHPVLPAVNKARARAMKAAARKMGYGYVEVKGTWIPEEGVHKGEKLLEYPLFIPNISYDDAVLLGQGKFVGGEDIPQSYIVFGDGDRVYLVQTNLSDPLKVQEFPELRANRPPFELKSKEDSAMTPEEKKRAEELRKIWDMYSEYRGRPWKYASVEWLMAEPPHGQPQGFFDAMAKHYWRDQDPHDFYVPPEAKNGTLIQYNGAVYREVVSHLPRKIVALLRKKWKAPRFTTMLVVPDKQVDLWKLNEENILLSKERYGTNQVGKFSWHPISGELLLAPVASFHATTIKNIGQYPFDEYVRGIVLPENKMVLTRPWVPNVEELYMTTGDPEEDKANQAMIELLSNESQEACKRALIQNGGVPSSWTFRFNVSNTDLQSLTGVFRW